MSRTPSFTTVEALQRELPHLSPSDARALAEILRRLIDAYEPERVYLFGSKARGDAGPDSDFDLMVIVPDNAPAERKQSRLAYENLWGTGVAADVLVWPAGRFAERLPARSSLPATIVREGKLLHAA
jgi:predicted nucleotidyltransferase